MTSFYLNVSGRLEFDKRAVVEAYFAS